MSLRSQIKKEGEYPPGKGVQETLKIDNQTIILTRYESEYGINLYVGGIKHWCIHIELIKGNGKIKEIGYLIKIRYDLLCSVEEDIKHGGDITKLLKVVIKYIHETYPEVKKLLFNDLSTRRCDNEYDVNLAVMSYLYSEKTWYEKNFKACISEQSTEEWKRIKNRLDNSKKLSWDIMRMTIYNGTSIKYSEDEIKELYERSTTWKEFFKVILDKITISEFCIFVSRWLDSFISKYFNNLMGLTYEIPIDNIDILYIKGTYKGGRYKSFFKGARKNRTIKRKYEIGV